MISRRAEVARRPGTASSCRRMVAVVALAPAGPEPCGIAWRPVVGRQASVLRQPATSRAAELYRVVGLVVAGRAGVVGLVVAGRWLLLASKTA